MSYAAPTAQARETVSAYIRFFENLSPQTVTDLKPLTISGFRFVDPFNDVSGQDKAIALLRKMFRDVEAPRFVVTDTFWQGDNAVLRWRFTAKQRFLGELDFTGLSELKLNPEGSIVSQTDYWDANQHFLAQIPLIGFLIRAINRRAAL
ncbi:nuclear transport factor 2 family protein [Polycladidibacter hongkongensis]|uniref:nuclear transport factor 2 family protein n=1 Tax=Polycladidibacter hongkongensis TaxID=1647556 RepID=UPI00082C3A2E|nr:nuclear transport factor 2 family protein [Pseudovibrio hongkongensis]